MMNTKTCSRCNQTFTEISINFQRSGSGTFRSECKSCTRQSDQKRDARRDGTGRRKIHNRVTSANIRARDYGRPGRITVADVLFILRGQSAQCFYCGSHLLPGQWHIDHKIPFALGGDNLPENIVASCADCNSQKAANTPLRHVSRLCARGIDSPVRRLFGVSAVATPLPLIFNVEGD